MFNILIHKLPLYIYALSYCIMVKTVCLPIPFFCVTKYIHVEMLKCNYV